MQVIIEHIFEICNQVQPGLVLGNGPVKNLAAGDSKEQPCRGSVAGTAAVEVKRGASYGRAAHP
jgi:hypothetical protein